MITLTDKVSFKLGISKEAFRLLIYYLDLFRRHGLARLVSLRETEDGQFIYWLRNSVCAFTVRSNFSANIVELRKVFFSPRLRKERLGETNYRSRGQKEELFVDVRAYD